MHRQVSERHGWGEDQKDQLALTVLNAGQSTMDEADSTSFFQLMPITVPSECQTLIQNNDQLQRCQIDAFDTWVRPWQIVPRGHLVPTGNEHLPPKITCCYRWSLLDCVTKSVNDYCDSFDLR